MLSYLKKKQHKHLLVFVVLTLADIATVCLEEQLQQQQPEAHIRSSIFQLKLHREKVRDQSVQLPVDNVIVVPAPAAETQTRWDVTNDVYLNAERRIMTLIHL